MSLNEAIQRIDKARNGNLSTLDLSNCGLHEVPQSVFELTHLTELKLGHWSDHNKQQRNKITKLPAQIAQLQQLQHLDLSSNQLSALPDALAELPRLQHLDMSNNKLEEIPQVICRLPNLQLLDLSNNEIKTIPQETAVLTQLLRLNLSKNLLLDLPDAFGNLSKLQRLDLSYNYLTRFPDALTRLNNLQQLSLIGNQIGQLPDNIDQLKNLRIAYLNNNQLCDLPPAFGQLSALQRLYISNNVLQQFPDAILQLDSIQLLDLRNNLLDHLPEQIGNLLFLEYLDIAQNRLTQLPESLANLTELQLLDLRSNRITTLPAGIIRLPNLQYLYINDNPIETPPPEIAARGLPAVRTYFREVEKAKEKDFLYEIKLLLVGEGRVGKTSLAKSLTIPDYELEDQQSTEGIDIQTWIIPKDELGLSKDFRVNLWDFGGQEIYHATHQFFLTKRSVYILVTESRKEDKHEDFYYWLNIIRILGDKSPVVLVLNKCDQPTKELPIKEYRKTFENIIGFSKISCQPDYRNTIDALKRKLKQVFVNHDLLPHLGTPLPKVWIDIRAAIEDLKLSGIDYISYKDYLKICKKHYQDEETAKFLGDFFHDLGVILHFTDDPALREIVFLNHDWVTKGVYAVLDNQRVKNKQGHFSDADLSYIWHDEQYSHQRDALLALMKNEKFELCFELRPGHYLAPQLLPVDEIEYEWNTDNNTPQLKFDYHYQFMPKGILTRFIVKQHRNIKQGINWRYGVVLELNNTRALVRELYFERKISIIIEGEQPQALLNIVRQTVQDINNSFNNLQVNEMLACQCNECSRNSPPHFFRLTLLEKYEQRGKQFIDCEKSLEPMPVRQLLSSVGHTTLSTQSDLLYQEEYAITDTNDQPDSITTTTTDTPQAAAETHSAQSYQPNEAADMSQNMADHSATTQKESILPLWAWGLIALVLILILVLGGLWIAGILPQ